MFYEPKPREELAPILESFRKNAKDQFGLEPHTETIRGWIMEMAEKKLRELIDSTFGDMNPKNLIEMAAMLDEQMQAAMVWPDSTKSAECLAMQAEASSLMQGLREVLDEHDSAEQAKTSGKKSKRRKAAEEPLK
jgi:hypothetical protein